MNQVRELCGLSLVHLSLATSISDEKKFCAELPEGWENLLQIDQGPQARMEAFSKFSEFLNNPKLFLRVIDQISLLRVALATSLLTAK
jgi:hypothetical protein